MEAFLHCKTGCTLDLHTSLGSLALRAASLAVTSFSEVTVVRKERLAPSSMRPAAQKETHCAAPLPL
jgi:hypothetical protein